MTRPGPEGSTTSEDGARFYDIDGEPFWSVTTALSIIAKDGLTWWAAGLAADAALAELPRLAVATITPPCGNTFNRCKQNKGENGHDWRITCPTCPCTVCEPCVREWLRRLHITKRDDRADEGIRTHDWAEHWVLNDGEHLPVQEDIAPYVRAFLAFVKAYGLRPDDWQFTEATVINRAEKYAGTTDGAIRFHADRTAMAAQLVARVLGVPLSVAVRDSLHCDVIFDIKTKAPLAEGKPVRVYSTVALQMAPYRWAPVIRLKTTGQERPMPDLHGAMALQLYPDLAVPRLCVSDEMTYLAFLNALNLYRWQVEYGTRSTSESSFPLPAEPPHLVSVPVGDVDGATVKPMSTRAPRKTAAKKATKAAAPPVDEESSAAAAQAKARSNATLASMTAKPAGVPGPPYDDDIPF